MKKNSGKIILVALIAMLISLVFIACDDEDEYDYGGGSGGSGAGGSGGNTPAAPVLSSNSSFTANDARVKMIEINQSLSWGFDTDTGGFFLMDHFVAGKETAIFVTFNDQSAAGRASNSYIVVYRDGNVVTQLAASDHQDGSVLYFQPKNMGDAGNWEAGAYTFELYLSDNEGSVAAVRSTTFFKSTTMKILAVPVVAKYGSYTARCKGDWQTAAQMVYATYPVAKTDVEYVLGPELDITRYDIETDNGQYELWNALRKLQTPNKDYTIIVGFIPYPIEESDGAILGYTYELPAVIVSEDNKEMMCTLIHEIAHCYGIGDEYEGGSINLSVNSPPYGMSGNDMYTGKKVTSQKQQVRSGFDFGVNGTGSMIYQEQRPFYPEGRAPLPSVSSHMGGGTDADSFEKWVSSEIWIHLFNTFVNLGGGGDASGVGISIDGGAPNGGTGGGGGTSGGGTSGGGSGYGGSNDYGWQCRYCCSFISEDAEVDFYGECGRCGCFTGVWDFDSSFECWNCGSVGWLDEYNFYIDCPVCENLNLFSCIMSSGNWSQQTQPNYQKTAQATVRAVEIKGFIGEDGAFTPSPWYVYETDITDVSMRRSGEYTVCFFDGKGNQLSASYFDVDTKIQINTPEGPRLVSREKVPVYLVAKFPEGTAKIIISKGDKQIYSTDVSKTAPVVSFTGLEDYDQLSNTATLTWEASGETDELYFEIWYCPNEDEYYNVAADVTGSSYTVDLSEYPGTDEGYFYIYATDGVMTGETDSPWVKVPFKAPEIIGTQSGVPETRITEEIFFDADIYDMQDGWLWGDEVSWTLNGREFMTGSLLWVWPYELPPGTHTFTCTAVNSAGLSAERDFTFIILDDESDLPDDWSRADIVNALSNGFVVPLNKLDEHITRGQYAGLMATLYGAMSELDDPYPDYRDGVVKDCGQDDYDQFLMVDLGVMNAPGGNFEPMKTLTESEAAVIMYKVSALADPEYFETDLSETEILGLLKDYEVISDRGDGAYRAQEKLTNRLALVRLSRLYDAVFE